jgi:uncharacterized protein YeaO (DUF488 family)
VRIRIKRAYEPAESSDGYRVLIDRLWPRGVTRERARLDEWVQELAPSAELRRWFGHDPVRFGEFRRRYAEELSAHEEKLRELRRRARKNTLTIVHGARDTEHNDAVVLAEILCGAELAASDGDTRRAKCGDDPIAVKPRAAEARDKHTTCLPPAEESS